MSQEQRLIDLADAMRKLNTIVAKYPGPGFTDGIFGDAAPLKPDVVTRDATAMAQEGRNLRVGIIGRVKAGKSSLLNALMFSGKDVLPKAATPMTASLTVLRYAEQGKPYAEVEYFRSEDVNDMRLLADEYDQRFRLLFSDKLAAAQEKASRAGGRAVPQPDPERIKAQVKRELDADPRLGGAKDMYQRIQSAGGLPASGNERVDGNDLEDLHAKLANYVGASGSKTPFTKCLTLYLPLPALEGVDVVDTPGVNDPVRSREERTMEELHNCDVVFVVSPSGQFLNQQDLELMGRLTYKDGVREVFLVASQVDGQLFGSEREKHGGVLSNVLQGLRTTLAEQARNSLGPVGGNNQGLDTLKKQLAERLVITSSVAYSLHSQPESEWDDVAKHAWSLLNNHYPNECAQLDSSKPHLEAMAGIAQTEALLDQVRNRKQSITEEKITAFLDDQAKALRGYLEVAPEVVVRNRQTFLEAKASDLEEKLNAIESFREAAVRATNVAVGDIVEDTGNALRQKIKSKIQELYTNVETTQENSRDSEVEYSDPSLGRKALSFITFGLVKAERTSTTVQTIDATKVRVALQNFQSSFSDQLQDYVEEARLQLRKRIEAGVIAALREHKVVNDRDIDTTRLAQACRSALSQVRELDVPDLPPVSSALMQNGTLKSYEARSFEDEAAKYLLTLKQEASKQSRDLTLDFEKRLNSADVGGALFSHYEEQLQGIQQQIQNRDQTIQKYEDLLVELKELRSNV